MTAFTPLMKSFSVMLAMLLLPHGRESRAPPSQPSTAPNGNVVFRDGSGDVVATADVELPEAMPAGDGTFKGNWKLLSSKPFFPSGSTKSGSYTGSVSAGLASI